MQEATDKAIAKPMTFQRFSAINAARCRDGFKHDLNDWSPSDWMVATVGELGEAANVMKKLNRERDGIKGNSQTVEALCESLERELADTFIYLDLMCQALGIDLESAVRRTFDAKSREIGYQHLIDPEIA
jgi:NTP pyrophosphatase (non-canonical NTP hydrolase)